MAMGRRKKNRQKTLWVETQALPRTAGHPFYEGLNRVLDGGGFDEFVEQECSTFYAEKMGRPGVPPAVYFRMLMVGYFEGLDSERGIAWRVSDSMSLRQFLGYDLDQKTPDHSSVSRTRRLIALETHGKVFGWILKLLATKGLLDGKTLGVDGTTLEANAALRSIVRRDSEQSYEDFLKDLARESGIETPTRQDLAKLDKKRPKKGSNDDWKHPHDPDASITKMKDGRTHLAHKAEHAVDMKTQAIVAVTLSGASEGDTHSLPWTLVEAESNLREVLKDKKAGRKLHRRALSEVVTDKGYHSNDTLEMLSESKIRSYVSEPDRGRRNWKGKPEAQQAVYANRRRIRGARGLNLQRQRGEVVERSFAHAYDTGGMRRLHLRHHGNILKRLLVHIGAFNLGLVMRKLVGRGTPRGLRDLVGAVCILLRRLQGLWKRPQCIPGPIFAFDVL